MPRNYVDNAYNRSVGRVGMPVGSAVISSSGGGSSGSYGGGGGGSSFSYGGGGGYSNSSTSSSRTYVDNAYNRSAGRVGMPVGSAVISSSSGGVGGASYSSSGSTSSSKTYVDNASNRALGRVGLPLGSAVHSRSSEARGNSSSSSMNVDKVYVDNEMNRSLGRVGLPHGTAVHSKSTSSTSRSSSVGVGAKADRVYVDNAYNQRLGRVGLPFGSAVMSKSTSSAAKTRCYVDNPMNRRLGRVGKPLGTAPVASTQTSVCPPIMQGECFRALQRIDPEDHNLNDIMDQFIQLRYELLNNGTPDPEREQQCEAAIGIVNRHEAALTKYRSNLKTPDWVRGGEIIPFEDLALGGKLGGGGFGDVFVGFWKESQVAVKKLRVQRVSQARKEQFQAEVRVFSQVDHPAIVKFYGACVTPPNLAIVMEFMAGGSMYDILHVEARPLSIEQKENMVTDCLDALKYLHKKNVTHRDIKSMNILICEDYNHCKLGDFGLALKEETHTTASVADHSVVGTLVYSPPEVVQGKRLKLEELKCADVYSMAVVIVEFLTRTVPYKGMNQHQVRQAILDGQRPSMGSIRDDMTKSLLLRALAASPSERPSASAFFREWDVAKCAGALERLDIQASSDGPITTHLPSNLSISTGSTSSSQNSASTSRPSTRSTEGSSRSSMASRSRCQVCLENSITHALRCGHVVCDQCLPNLRSCPQCRGTISDPVRIYL